MARQDNSCCGCIQRGFFGLIGWLSVALVYFMIGLNVYVWARVVCPLLKSRLGSEFGMVWAGIGVIAAYNIIFNHLAATFIKPGSVVDTKRVERMRIKDKQRASKRDYDRELDEDYDDRFSGISQQVKKLLRYRAKTVANLEEFWTKKCKITDEILPARARYCPICGQCTLLMEQHCIVINNCVGLENYRYYLLFLLYAAMGSGYMVVTIASIKTHHLYQENIKLMTMVGLIDLTMFVVVSAFSCWSWFLAFVGSTSVEFWRGEGTGLYDKEAILRFDTISDNLFRIFGTHSLIRVLSPSFRSVPFTGLEWSFWLRDAGYDCDGLQPDPSELKDDEAAVNYGQVMNEDDVELVQITGLSDAPGEG